MLYFERDIVLINMRMSICINKNKNHTATACNSRKFCPNFLVQIFRKVSAQRCAASANFEKDTCPKLCGYSFCDSTSGN